MRLITYDDIKRQIQSGEHYYQRRWEYLSHVVDLIKSVDPQTVIELGPYRLPICDPCDTIDKREKLNPTFCFDASVTPWPIEGRYDLFVATQVFEHLGTNQRAAFDEAFRIADNVLISLPYRWNCPSDPIHHGVDDERIAEWTGHRKPDASLVVGSRCRRWIGLWRG